MSLNWQWSEKVGSVEYDFPDSKVPESERPVCNLYSGNALLIAVWEYPNGTYNMDWFWVDKDHMKNMLGLNKGYENCMNDIGIKSIKLDTNYRQTPAIVQALVKSKTKVMIELY